MKSKIAKIFIIVLSLLPMFVVAAGVSDYQLLSPITEKTGATTPDLQSYLIQIYWYAMYLAVGLAVVMIVIGGVEYTLTWTKEVSKEQAKQRITNALKGLILALATYVILYAINPNLVSLQIK